MPTDFDKQSYWHDRFTTETSFEWLVPSSVFMSILEPYLATLPPSANILHIGFGTSDLQTHLRARGFTNILNIDFEPLAIRYGQELEKRTFGDVVMRYQVADATTELGTLTTALGGEKFDLVVDKSTVDAVSCGGEEGLLRMVEGVRGLLLPRNGSGSEPGVWVSLSYRDSRFAIEGWERSGMEVEVLARIPTAKRRETDPDVYYWCYLLRPRG